MPKKKKETTGLLIAVAPVAMEEKEKKSGGGLLSSDRQRYQKGETVRPNEGEGRVDDGVRTNAAGDIIDVSEVRKQNEDWDKRQERYRKFMAASYNNTKFMTNMVRNIINLKREEQRRGEEIDWKPKEVFIEEFGEEYYNHLEESAIIEMNKPFSQRLKEDLGSIWGSITNPSGGTKVPGRDKWGDPIEGYEREGNKGGGLLSSDRQQYAEGDEAEERPIANYGNPPYRGLRNYDPTEFEDLDALPTGVTGDIIAQQRKLRESLLMSLDNLMDTEARRIMDNPGYTEEVSGLLRPFTRSISPFEQRINEAYTNYDNEFSSEDIDNPYSSGENMQEEILQRVEILRQIQKEDKQREQKQEGGLLGEAPMEQSIPTDTPPMVPEEPMVPQEPMVPEEPMVPDEQMEDNYLEFVISESLEDSEEVYLMDKLESDPQLSIIFDKIMNTATEFAGSGPVEGPGSAVSDSIPARLSDGEFVLTSKATDEIGPDNIQAMMKDAEARSDQRQIAQEGGVIREDLENLEDTDAIKKGMLSVNPRMRTG